MGWGIYLYPQIYYSKVDYKSKWDIEREMDDLKRVIKMLEQELLALVMTTEPEKIMEKDYDGSPMEWLIFEYRKLTEGYEDSIKGYYYKLWKLELLYENWDNAHNNEGKAISPPKGTFKNWNTAYIDGDYVESVQEENESNE